VLLALNNALLHNFFADTALLLPTTYSHTIPDAIITKDQRIAQLKQENVLLTNERNLLLQVLAGDNVQKMNFVILVVDFKLCQNSI
jgi:hypothetical protein